MLCRVHRENGLNVMLYFDLPPSHQASNSDVILHVLSSSAPRLKAEQGDVISINNLPVKVKSFASFRWFAFKEFRSRVRVEVAVLGSPSV